MSDRHPDLDAFDQALADYERTLDESEADPVARAHAAIASLAGAFGFVFGLLTDGTIVLEPRPDADHCGVCATGAELHDTAIREQRSAYALCEDCGVVLTVFTRCQVVSQRAGHRPRLVYVCPEHYAARTGL